LPVANRVADRKREARAAICVCAGDVAGRVALEDLAFDIAGEPTAVAFMHVTLPDAET